MGFWRRKIDQEQLVKTAEAMLTGSGLTLETITVKGQAVLAILTGNPDRLPEAESVRAELEHRLAPMRGVKTARVVLTAERKSSPPPPSTSSRKAPAQIDGLATGVKHIIAVASGKGGVGKSTVATNLAVALAKSGMKTGLLDADIYGPSIPMMMGQQKVKPATNENGKLVPITAHGVACMSMGFLVDTDAPMIWRGPMVQTAIVQMLRDVDWSGVEVLVIDLPPGTGDAQLTLAQKIKLSGAIIVSTPQDVALIDARKGLEMFQKVDVPILGLVQNMGLYCCPNCGHQSAIFGQGGVADVAQKLGVPLLADIPIDPRIREQGDAGVPIAALADAGAVGQIYADLARSIIGAIPLSTHSPLSQG